jgi:hypothetical protein
MIPENIHHIQFNAYGHPNIQGLHSSTFEITTAAHLSLRGDCIIGIRSAQSAQSLARVFGESLRQSTTQVITRLVCGPFTDEIRGWGSPDLSLQNSLSLVWRKSTHIDNRTIALKCSKAAKDLNRDLIALLKNPQSLLQITIQLSLPAILKSKTT